MAGSSKQAHRILLIFVFLVVFAGIILLLPSDTYPGEGVIPGTPTIHKTLEVGQECTLLDCTGILYIGFVNKIPNSFIMEIHDDQKRVFFIEYLDIIRLKWLHHRGIYEMENKTLEFTDPVLNSIPEAMSLVEKCTSPSGVVQLRFLDKILNSIYVQCFESSMHLFFTYIDFGYTGVQIENYSPEKIQLTIYWGGNLFTQIFEPDYYEEHSPNGTHCEPTCLGATIELDIP